MSVCILDIIRPDTLSKIVPSRNSRHKNLFCRGLSKCSVQFSSPINMLMRLSSNLNVDPFVFSSIESFKT